MRTDLSTRPVHCVMCTTPIPEERLRFGAVTCTKDCQKARDAGLRSRRDRKVCRYCMRPSSPTQRGLFARWKKTAKRAAESPSLPVLMEALPAVEAYLKTEGKTISADELTRVLTYLVDSHNAAPENVEEMTLADFTSATGGPAEPEMEAAS